MDRRRDRWTEEWKDRWMEEWTNRWIEEWTNRWMDGRTDRWMDEHLEIHPCALQDIGPLGPLPKNGRGYIGESILS